MKTDVDLPPIETPCIVTMPDGVEFKAMRILVSVEGGYYSAWGTVVDSESKAPLCWTDGVCWDENEDGKPSIKPRSWRLV